MISGSTHQDVYQNVETLNCAGHRLTPLGLHQSQIILFTHFWGATWLCFLAKFTKKQQFINSSLFTNRKINQNPSKSLYSPDIPRVSLMDILHGFVGSIRCPRIPDSGEFPQNPGPKALAPLRAYPDGHGRIPSERGVRMFHLLNWTFSIAFCC